VAAGRKRKGNCGRDPREPFGRRKVIARAVDCQGGNSTRHTHLNKSLSENINGIKKSSNRFDKKKGLTGLIKCTIEHGMVTTLANPLTTSRGL
jgi:hypothetical protein